jgi:amidase
LGFKSAVELANLIRARQIGSLELTDYFIDRITRYDDALNAVVVRDFERARAAAREADAALAKGDVLGPLHGLPMTIKESFDIAGLPTTWGIPSFASNVATRDAEMVKRYKAAGAVFMGKTNVATALADFQSYNDIYGTTNNPWNLERTPGGSSGGSAAALAAGLTGMCSGSDIGGSLRNPAHFCGVYGHKPTWGVVPSDGHALPPHHARSDLAVVGPIARSAEDIALAMEVVSGPDPLSAPGWRLELPKPRAAALGELRVVIWADDPICPVDREIVGRVGEIADLLAAEGAQVSDTARPRFRAADSHAIYLNLLGSVMGAAVSDRKYALNQELAAALAVEDISRGATMLRASVLDHRSWLRFDSQRTALRAAWQEFFADWDIVLCPVMPTTAYHHDHRPQDERIIRVNDREVSYLEQVFWAALASVAYLPSTVFPTGLSQEGLPVGLQAIGRAFGDRTTIEFARLLAAEIDAYTPPPGYAD